MIPKTKIEITPAMSRFNDAVERFDRLTQFKFDRCTARQAIETLRPMPFADAPQEAWNIFCELDIAWAILNIPSIAVKESK